MKSRNPLVLSLVATMFLSAGGAFGAGENDEIDVGNIARKSVYVAGVPVAAASYFVINHEIKEAWKIALPAESKAFADAAKELSKTTASRDSAASALSDISDKYVKARDGYQYTTYHTEYSLQPVMVNSTDAEGNTTSSMQLQSVGVDVPTIHDVAPDKALATKLKPDLAKSQQAADSANKTFAAVESTHGEKLKTLQTAQKEALAGKRQVDAKALSKIKKLKVGRVVVVAAGVGMAAYGIYDLVGHKIINSAEAMPLREERHQGNYESNREMNLREYRNDEYREEHQQAEESIDRAL